MNKKIIFFKIVLFLFLFFDNACAIEMISREVDFNGNKENIKFVAINKKVLVDAVQLSRLLQIKYDYNNSKKYFSFQPTNSYRKYLFKDKNKNVDFYYSKYKMMLNSPCESLSIEGKFFISFDFFIKLINASYIITSSNIYITKPEITALDSLETILREDKKYFFTFEKDFHINENNDDFNSIKSAALSALDKGMSIEPEIFLNPFRFIKPVDEIIQSRRINDIVNLLIPTQSYEVIQESQDQKKNINLAVSSADRLHNTIIKAYVNNNRKKNLNQAIDELGNQLKNYIRLHGQSVPQEITDLYKKIDFLAGDSSFLKNTSLALNITPLVLDQINGSYQFLNRNKTILNGLMVLSNNYNNINANLSDKVYKKIKKEHDSYKNLLTKLKSTLFDYDLFKTGINLIPALNIVNIISFSWELVSNIFFDRNITNAENFILTSYGSVFTYDIALVTKFVRDRIFSNFLFTEQQLDDLISISYLLIKNCYTTRELAFNNSSLKVSRDILSRQKNIQEEVKNHTIIIGNKSYGYMPFNEKKYLDNYDDLLLLNFLNIDKQNDNPVIGKWHAKLEMLGSNIFFPIIFSDNTVEIYGPGAEVRKYSAIYKKDNDNWYFSDDYGKKWHLISFYDKDNMIITHQGLTLLCKRSVNNTNNTSELKNPLIGKWHAKLKVFGSTGIMPIVFKKDRVLLYMYGDKPKVVPIIYRYHNTNWYISDDKGKTWHIISFENENSIIFMVQGFTFTCKKISN